MEIADRVKSLAAISHVTSRFLIEEVADMIRRLRSLGCLAEPTKLVNRLADVLSCGGSEGDLLKMWPVHERPILQPKVSEEPLEKRTQAGVRRKLKRSSEKVRYEWFVGYLALGPESRF